MLKNGESEYRARNDSLETNDSIQTLFQDIPFSFQRCDILLHPSCA